MTVLEQVALGFDQAKKTVYDIARKYYAKIDKSRSNLVNAIFSSISYIYSMFQTFAKLIQDELYVSTATELESLYKLIPFVGMKLSEPLTMKISANATPQDFTITNDSELPIYMTGADPFTDTNGFKFYLRSQTYVRQKLFTFDTPNVSGRTSKIALSKVASDGKSIELSLGKLLGPEFVPVSLYDADAIVVEVPYISQSTLQKAVVVFQGNAGTIKDANQSTVVSDIDLTNCLFQAETGRVKIAFMNDVFLNILNEIYTANLEGQTVNISMTYRSSYKKNLTHANEEVASYVFAPVFSPYVRDNVFINRNNAQMTFTAGAATGLGIMLLGVVNANGMKPESLKIRKGAQEFDFSNATIIYDDYWGSIYKTSIRASGYDYYAYIIDPYMGLIAFEDPTGTCIPSAWQFDYEDLYGSKMVMEQYEKKSKTVNPTTEFDFDSLTYILEDADPILFEELLININKVGYENLQFIMTDNVDAVQGDSSKTYFEVQPLAPNRIKIRFEKSVSYSTIENLTIIYKVVKQIPDYPSGTQGTGATPAKRRDATVFLSPAGGSVFTFEVVNITAQAGVAGIPTLEGLRSTLEKSAYTFDRYVTRTNYEAAIQAWFVSQGQDARIKVFEYMDFGLLFLNSTNGNIVFYMGLKNKFANQDPVLVVPVELTSDQIGGDSSAQYTRAFFTDMIPLAPADIGGKIILVIGQEADEANTIRLAVNPDIAMTNYLLTDATFVRMYSVFFKVKIRARQQYTFADANTAVRRELAQMFTWSKMQFVRDLNVSDVYRVLDNLVEVEKVLLTNMSHRKNNGTSGALKVKDVSYKSLTTPAMPASTTIKATARASDNAVVALQVTGSMVAKYGGDVTKIDIGTNPGFVYGDKITITGFLGATNNPVNASITSVAGTVLGLSGAAFTTETATAKAAFSLVDLLATNQRRVTIAGFANPANANLVNVSLTAVDSERLVINLEDAVLTNETYKTLTVTPGDNRLENPLWDFSTAASNRRIGIDVLALGGIETEAY